jgi:hypothetical protein
MRPPPLNVQVAGDGITSPNSYVCEPPAGAGPAVIRAATLCCSAAGHHHRRLLLAEVGDLSAHLQQAVA